MAYVPVSPSRKMQGSFARVQHLHPQNTCGICEDHPAHTMQSGQGLAENSCPTGTDFTKAVWLWSAQVLTLRASADVCHVWLVACSWGSSGCCSRCYLPCFVLVTHISSMHAHCDQSERP